MRAKTKQTASPDMRAPGPNAQMTPGPIAAAAPLLFINPVAANKVSEPWPIGNPFAFHRGLPGYTESPLIAAPSLASAIGVAHVWIKDESLRLGLPSFKIIGASWAVRVALCERLGHLDEQISLEDLAAAVDAHPDRLRLTCATDGNHGRAVARMAKLIGMAAHILVPGNLASSRISAIAAEGATVEVVQGTYDDAVDRCAAVAKDDDVIVSDTSWPGYADVPRAVIDGYSTIMKEVDDQLSKVGGQEPTVVLAQLGVGSFGAAVVRHFKSQTKNADVRVLGVEPDSAACLQASVRSGALVAVPGPHDSIMAGLNCGVPSEVAWHWLRTGLDGVVAIGDDVAATGMRMLAHAGLVGGECSGAAVGALHHVLQNPGAAALAAGLGLGRDSTVLLFLTEGDTNPDDYVGLVGRTSAEVRGLAGVPLQVLPDGSGGVVACPGFSSQQP